MIDNKLPRGSKPLAIFDLDGTLTSRDSFVAYLVTLGWRHRRYSALAGMPILIAAYLARLMKDYQLKQRLIGAFVAGVDPAVILEHNAWFCERWLPQHLHPVGHRLLQEHLKQQHRVILLSASPDIFVPQIARALGVAEVVCTRVKQVSGIWRGELDGPNCKGAEKLVALQRYLDTTDRPLGSFSYGDSKSDLTVLSWVEHGAWIRKDDFIPLGDIPRSVFPWPSR